MLDEHSTTPRNHRESQQEPRLLTEKPTINILLYTDHPLGITNGTGRTDLSTMISHLHAHAPTFARLRVKWLSRYSSSLNNADNKLSDTLIKDYDQIWFFGIYQMNIESDSPSFLRGGQENELDEDEVNALIRWMNIEGEKARGGGVLMTGDHANHRPRAGQPGQNESCPDNSEKEKFLGLGRALGRCVPRAGLLRKWEGPPTKCKKNSFNTQTLVSGIDPDEDILEGDNLPLQLLLTTFDAKGNPSPGGRPHPLFFYKGGKVIRVYPDHTHEGAVIIPTEFDEKDWPKGKKVWPKPQVVARGIDHRNCRKLKILAAYNGDRAGVGRVVADSTWHHYLNKNLFGFLSPAPEGSAADQIGQFYGNLALWLAPLSKRREMAFVMFCWLANHLFLLEEMRLDEDCEGDDEVLDIGRAAYSILSEVASPCEIHELLQAVIPDDYCEDFETLQFPERGYSLSLFPSKEVILGYIVDAYQQEINRIEAGENQDAQLNLVEVTNSGFKKAFNEHVKKLTQAALDVRAAYNIK